MSRYNVDEMRNNRTSFSDYDVYARASKMAIKISGMLETLPVYEDLAGRLPSPRLILYFQYALRREIYPYVEKGAVIEWYRKNGRPLPFEDDIVRVPRCGILPLMERCWDIGEARVQLVGPLSTDRACVDHWGSVLKERARRSVAGVKALRRPKVDGGIRKSAGEDAVIASHYSDGFANPLKRNDLAWYPRSGIDPRRVLIYIDKLSTTGTGRPITKEAVAQIERCGFSWIALDEDAVEECGRGYWRPTSAPRLRPLRASGPIDGIQRWIMDAGNDLIGQVSYWRSFYDEFNVRIHYVPEDGLERNISQAIAFDIDKDGSGALVGTQRSEIFTASEDTVCYHPKHVFFTWHGRARYYYRSNSDRIESIIVTGYPQNIFRQYENMSEGLRRRGARFTVVLFDTNLSSQIMEDCYRAFLEWVIEDPGFGLIIKSKKPKVIRGLPSIHALLEKAKSTGRCVEVKDPWGRLPSEAAFGADFAVGIGISSALIEAVIAGCRGAHYDIYGFKDHEFYKWGYGRLIFNDLDELVSAIKRYMKDRASAQGLGDWAGYIDKLDPYRDGCGGERIGTYLRWLLESFGSGRGRQGAIDHANRLYIDRWGVDKVIDMRSIQTKDEEVTVGCS